MAAQEKVVEDFKAELNTLSDCRVPVSRTKITAITKQAMKAVKYYKHVVMIVEKFVSKCSPLYKLPALYVVDSIVRQSKHQFTGHKEVFGPRFSKNLEKTFSQLFKCTESDVPKVIRVLNLWQKNKVYSPEVIQPLLNLAPPIAGSPQEQPSSTQPPPTLPDPKKPSSNASPIAPQPMDSLLQKQQDQLITLLEVGAEAGSGKSELLEVILDKAKKLQALQTIQQKLIADKTDHQSKVLEAQSTESASLGVPQAPPHHTPPRPPRPQSTMTSSSSARQSVVANEFSKALLQDFDYSSDEDGDIPRPPMTSNKELPSELSIIDQLDEQFQREKMLQVPRPLPLASPQEHSPFPYKSLSAPPEEPQFHPIPSEPQLSRFSQENPHENPRENSRFQDAPRSEQAPPHLIMQTQQEMQHHTMPHPPFPPVSQPLFMPPAPPNPSEGLPSSNMPPSFGPPGFPLLPPHPPQGLPPQGGPPPQRGLPPQGPPSSMGHFPAQPPQDFGKPGKWQSFLPSAQGSKFSSDPPPFHFHKNSPRFRDNHSNSPRGFDRNSPLQFDRSNSPSLRFDRNSPHRFERNSPPPSPPPQSHYHGDSPPPHRFHDHGSPRPRDDPPPFKRGRGEWVESRRERGSWGDRGERGGDWERNRGGGEWEEWDRGPGRFHDRERERSPLRFDRSNRWTERGERNERNERSETSEGRSADRDRKWSVSNKHKHITVYSTTVWVGHLAKSFLKVHIEEAFSEFGSIKSVDHVVARGCAYVVMDDRNSAEQAIKELGREGSNFGGIKCKLAWAPGRGVKSKKYREFWNVDVGVSIVPWKLVKNTEDLESVCDGGWADPDTIDPALPKKEVPPEKEENLPPETVTPSTTEEVQGKWQDVPLPIPPPGPPPPMIMSILGEPPNRMGGPWLEPPVPPPGLPPPMVSEANMGMWPEPPPPIPPVFPKKPSVSRWDKPSDDVSNVPVPRPLFDTESNTLQESSTGEVSGQDEELNEDQEVKEMEIDEEENDTTEQDVAQDTEPHDVAGHVAGHVAEGEPQDMIQDTVLDAVPQPSSVDGVPAQETLSSCGTTQDIVQDATIQDAAQGMEAEQAVDEEVGNEQIREGHETVQQLQCSPKDEVQPNVEMSEFEQAKVVEDESVATGGDQGVKHECDEGVKPECENDNNNNNVGIDMDVSFSP